MPYHKVYRTLLLWLLWASFAITVIVALYIDTNVWEFIKHDNTKLTWVILLLFLLSTAISLWLTITLTHESVELIEIDYAARQQGLMGIITTPENNAVRRFFNSLKAVVMVNGDNNLEALLATELAFYQRVSHGLAVIGNLLIMLGLIGTVIGLSITLSGLSSSLDALGHDEALMLEGLRKAMSGMGTAFYATLLGAVFGGLLLRIFALITETGVEDIGDRVMKISLVYCAADCKRTEEKDVRILNGEIIALTANTKLMAEAFAESRTAMTAFHEEAKRLHEFNNADGKGDDVATLREAIRVQKHYRALLRQEIKLVDQVNRAWWPPLLRVFMSKRRTQTTPPTPSNPATPDKKISDIKEGP